MGRQVKGLEPEFTLKSCIFYEAIWPGVRLKDGGWEGRIKNRCRWGDRFSERTTHVSATALQLGHNVPKSDPSSKNKQSTEKAKL
jgi:hypothetical protein